MLKCDPLSAQQRDDRFI